LWLNLRASAWNFAHVPQPFRDLHHRIIVL
jgi:hypothetical protein